MSKRKFFYRGRHRRPSHTALRVASVAVASDVEDLKAALLAYVAALKG